jgi:hypothetical protein
MEQPKPKFPKMTFDDWELMRHFSPSKFKYPQHMDRTFMKFIDEARAQSGVPFMEGGDGRMPGDVTRMLALGGSPNTLHAILTNVGCRALDIDTRFKDLRQHGAIITGVLKAAIADAKRKLRVHAPATKEEVITEAFSILDNLGIELVDEQTDSHIHVDVGYPGHPFKRPLFWRSKD